jgi:glycosyltransferase involved in cell wall biosynthesis
MLRDRTPLEPILAIVGDGVERQRLEAQALELGLAGDVKFYGEIRDPHDVCPYFLCARVLALPGAGGLALYQALAHGLPAVATSADGTERDLVADGETGFICDPGDIATFALRLGELIAMPQADWAELSSSCRQLTRGRRHSLNMVGQLKAAVASAAGRPDILTSAGSNHTNS